MMNRRQCLGLTLGASAAMSLSPQWLWAAQQNLGERIIPSSGEKIPVIGLGSSATFAQFSRSEDLSNLKEVMRTFFENGGRVFDTAPAYGGAEEAAGKIAQELGIHKKVFWATKLNVATRNGSADPKAAHAQVEQSFKRLGVEKIDLIQIHNTGDLATQLPILKELKAQQRIRYIGITTTFPEQYALLESMMRNEPIDFVGLDYAIDNRDVEEKLLPLAIERKIGVLAYLPFGRTSLFKRVANVALPQWASEFDAKTWAQFFIKYVISHPAITAVTPSTSQAKNMLDNIGGGIGRLPDQAMRKRMIELIDAQPYIPVSLR